jgi:hypothetical protein
MTGGANGAGGPGTLDAVAAAKHAAVSADAPERETRDDPGGLSAALSAKDQSFARGGFIAHAIEEAVRAEGPAEGKARFEVSLMRDGTMAIALLSASQNHDAFAKLSASIKKRIPTASLHLPSRAKGLRVLVELDVHDQYPDGMHPSEVGKSAFYAGPGEYSITKDSVIIKKMPGVSFAVKGKAGGIGISVGPGGVAVSGGLSLENVGSAARKMVSAKVSRESLL